MSIVIATGCSHSGWEMVLPILQQGGLEPVGDSLARWHGDLLLAARVSDPLTLTQPLQPTPAMARTAAGLLPETSTNAALLADSRSVWLLDFWAKELPEARFLLLYTRAETAVVQALLQGMDPLTALERWEAANRQILSFLRRHRRRAVLLDAEAACRQPQGLVDACQRIGIALKTSSKSPAPVIAPALERLLAGHVVTAQRSALALEAELEASAQPIGEDGTSAQVTAEQLLDSYRRRLAQASKLQQEIGSVREQLQEAEQAREAQARRAAELESAIEKARDGHKGLEVALKKGAEENELLLLQLHQVQEELEATLLQKKQLEGDLAGRQNEFEALADEKNKTSKHVAELEARVKELTKERDAQAKRAGEIEKLTKARDEQAKLAAERQMNLEQEKRQHQTLAATHEETVKENELLLLQLHQVQEELEVTFLQKKQLEQAQQEQGRTLEELRSQNLELTKARDLLAGRQKELEALAGEKKKTSKQVSELETKIKELTKERDAEAKVANDRQSQIEKLTKARDEQAKLAAERQTQLEQEKRDRQSLAATHDETVKENELLLLQLHQVQEELESIFFQKQNYERSYGLLEKKLKESANELRGKDREIGDLKKALAKLKETTSWKLTAPVRAVAKPFKKPNKETARLKEQIQLLRSSGLFDEVWYLDQYQDVAFEGADPIEHYIRHGAAEGRNPSPDFNSKSYLECNPDVAEAGINPLVHFVKFGKAEGRVVSNERSWNRP